MGKLTLYIIDDCSATNRRIDEEETCCQSWVCQAATPSKAYNAVLKDLREQTHWVAPFHCKDCDIFEDCLRENDAVPGREQRALVRQQLAETKHTKLLLKTDQPAAYMVC